MRNYKLNTEKGYSILGSEINVFSREKNSLLVSNGWQYNELFRQYTKTVAPFYTVVLDLGRNALMFNDGSYFTPAELDYHIGKDKDTREKIYKFIRELKKKEILK